ncbi:hypothetical protein SSX86_007822 [Deinandra increscens subsp. villosa]|uniref:Uncharacterized protein n=1 Tax=Deinandra increscens subsp. villosa TaxID=3103831 RepID=A0AAP0H3F7_9ASTR
MAVINQQVEEDDNNNESSGSTSSIDASKAASLKLEMIRLYEGKFEDEDEHGSRVSVSVSVSSEVESEIRNIYEETICPMICADINRKHQNFLFMIKEKFGMDLLTEVTWNLHNTESHFGSRSLQLKFLNGISTTVITGKNIKGNERKPFSVALVDGISGQIVTTGAEAAMEVEIVVLECDSNDDEVDRWTSGEFNKMIVSEWNGKKVLQGNTFVKLNKGTVSLDKISFTHNSVWKGQRKCRMGARSVDAAFPARVKEAKTVSFIINDKRNLLYCKHEIPSLSDPVYRLKEISKSGKRFEQLSKAHIKTVMDLLAFHAINPQGLKNILNVSPNIWTIIMSHAKMCKDDQGIYLYYYPRDGQKSNNGVTFNISGQLVGVFAESQFVPCDNLPYGERADAEKLIGSSSEHWEEVVPFNNQDSLIKHIQSRTTLNPSTHNSLNVVIPVTTDPHDHTNLTSPKSQSQSPKRPASEQAILNSPKQPRYDHPKLSSYTRSDGIGTSNFHNANNLELPLDEDEEYLQYLNLLDQWKILWCAVSVILKLRKRKFCHRNTFIVIAAPMEHAKTCD